MFAVIVGLPFSGRRTIENYLISKHGFSAIRLSTCVADESDISTVSEALTFTSPSKMLEHITKNWRSRFVTRSLATKELIEPFVKRPSFMMIFVDAPLLMRFNRATSLSAGNTLSLESFVSEHDALYYGPPPLPFPSNTEKSDPALVEAQQRSQSSLESCKSLTNNQLSIVNDFPDANTLHEYLDSLNILDPLRLRPDWDTYFMTLASLASRRSNCMKRRVGALLVRNNRILSTGYNGTPRGVRNCADGGCRVCNGTSHPNDLDECLCLHAEENALLEAGRERVGDGAVLYCNTCPCLRCTVKIVQTGVKEVVYNLSYKVDDASARVFAEAGVSLRRHAPPPL